MPIRLTRAAIEALQPRDKLFTVYDTEVARLGIRVRPTGAKSWTFEYRPGGGRRSMVRRLTLGKAEALPPEAARRKAKQLQATVLLGGDPVRQRGEDRKALTLAELAEQYLTEEVEPKRRPRTAVMYRLYFTKHALPVLGNRRARDLARSDIAALHRKIGRHAEVTANRTLAVLSAMFKWAAGIGEVPEGFNPVRGVGRFRESGGRERFLSTDELSRLGDALALAESKGVPWDIDRSKPTAKHAPKKLPREKIPPHVTGAIRLLILTGCRLREILHLRWDEVDFERGMLFLPDSKTGRRPVHLSAAALAVLDALPQVGPYVIPGITPASHRHDLHKPWRAITRLAHLEGVRLHDLRHTHASIGAGLGLGLPIIGKLLGHKHAASTSRYAHLGATPLQRAADSIGATLAGALNRSPKAAVLPIRRKPRVS